jgi:hypothetical protein
LKWSAKTMLRLLDILKALKCRVLLSGYFCSDLRGRAPGLARLQVPSGHARRPA